jgi:Pyruvate-formate lyase-activating enzyme
MSHPKQEKTSGSVARVASVLPYSCVDGPGNRMVFFLQGCQFRCPGCHNPETIERDSASSFDMSLAEAVTAIYQQRHFIRGITVSGGEASLQWRFVRALFRAVKQHPELAHLTCLIDTNGSVSCQRWQALSSYMDGAMVDMKAWGNDAHRALTGHSPRRVRDSLIWLAQQGKLQEVRLLLVPGYTDWQANLSSLCAYLYNLQQMQLTQGNVFSVRLNGFHRAGVKGDASNWLEATQAHLDIIKVALQTAGLQTVTMPPPELLPAMGDQRDV